MKNVLIQNHITFFIFKLNFCRFCPPPIDSIQTPKKSEPHATYGVECGGAGNWARWVKGARLDAIGRRAGVVVVVVDVNAIGVRGHISREEEERRFNFTSSMLVGPEGYI